jgi:hypothetical protein
MKLQKHVLMALVILVAGNLTFPTGSCACWVFNPLNNYECCDVCCSDQEMCKNYLDGKLNTCEHNQYCDEDPVYCENLCYWQQCLLISALNNDEIKIATLRKFRDEVLSKTPVGREYIKFYYEWSPFIVRAMEEDEEFKQEVQALIEQLLPMIEAMVQ